MIETKKTVNYLHVKFALGVVSTSSLLLPPKNAYTTRSNKWNDFKLKN